MSALVHDSAPGIPHRVSEELAQFALGLSYAEIPAAVRDRGKHLILDSVGIALASTKYPFASVSLAALEQLGAGTSPVIGIGRRLALRDAALMNGILIHGLDFDDTHSRGVIHATASSFPCALALADRDDLDGKALLAAYVAAMEVATRLGAVAKGGFHQVGFHPTGLVGAFGCALAAARILGVDADRATMAQGIALSMASGSLEFLEDGAWTKRMHPGWAAVVGITAATLAQQGFVGPRGAYDGRFGLYASHLGKYFEQADLALATEDLGRSWQIEEVAVKPIPACHFAHAAADAAAVLYKRHGVAAEPIRRVRVLVPQEVVKTVCEPLINKRNPANSYDAQFSIPYIVATALLKGRFTLAELEESALKDRAVLNLASRVDYEIDRGSTFPRHYTGEVIVETEDGRTLRHREAINRGCADRPLSNDEVVAKFFDNAERAIERKAAERIRDAVLDFDRRSARSLADTLCARA
ncbi:MAG TPA: MmgE/PrpD family protein [Xanthobacteraceae bacterium]|nr:MmgE/PrpD family protein [Xanthobacteraceae bacterium]